MKIFSGIKPSGIIHLGNYIGALRQWVILQDAHECLFCIVDLHALTVRVDPALLRRLTLETAATYIACGLDAKKSVLFIQSHVPPHAELAWILNTLAKISELKLMHQFKEKSKSNPENINAGLFDYPVLMAADILLYDATHVPVGQDQQQHIELARELARRFNSIYGKTFVVPEGMIPPRGAKIMALDNPAKKMEKTGSIGGYIALTDTPDVIRKKIKSAVTDSGSDVLFDEKKKPALSNLITIYHLLSGLSIPAIEKEYQGKGYGQFKKGLSDVTIDFLKPIQQKFSECMGDPGALLRILEKGACAARAQADKKMQKVKENIGLIA
ncbi:tryptophan--tRNA ligase [Candidatus Uhrbacteria bacterium]|nr:tryptophan--tRNA ligase [Candidatus Uhrbacteria bacterium]